METLNKQIPLSLYVHIPWCIAKCPYCDFNSHPKRGRIPENNYTSRLIDDLRHKAPLIQDRQISSIFIGGGTPSLLSPNAYQALFKAISDFSIISRDTEITLEANPGTMIPNRFEGYLNAGINRLSVGIQSFQNDKLKSLGRIHNANQAAIAINDAKKAGFENINIDLMFGLPNQNINDALFDLQSAINCNPSHISWYQLTLEPNTLFYRFKPTLPCDDLRCDMQYEGQSLLAQHGFLQYEISAYAKANNQCQHNLNYWQFGDYIGIGAGAHGKITDLNTGQITRHWNVKHPKQYLSMSADQIAQKTTVHKKELPLEFMMNALRLYQPISFALFEARTGLSVDAIEKPLKKAETLGLLTLNDKVINLSQQGRLFLNDVLELF